MHIILETTNEDLITEVKKNAGEEDTIILSKDRQDQTKEQRIWTDLHFASIGARYWSNTKDEFSPIYAGKLPVDMAGVTKLIDDAKFAENRAKYFSDFNVKYLGRTYVDPMNILVVDNKKGNLDYSPIKSDELSALLSSLPDNWWGSFGIVSTTNVDRLGTFLDYLSETNILAYSSAAKAKLRFLGLDYAEIPSPTRETSYGLAVREAASRLKVKR